MSRSLALGLSAAAALAIGGCRQNGTLQVNWSFREDATTTQIAASGCGQHGVDAILVTVTDASGDDLQVTAICPPGQVSRSVPTGTWTGLLQALDAQGAVIHSPIDPSNPSQIPLVLSEPVTIQVIDDGPPTAGVVTFTPLPACSDGIDNDGDGRVDLADPDCGNDPNGTHE
jgi:hypothetical protein